MQSRSHRQGRVPVNSDRVVGFGGSRHGSLVEELARELVGTLGRQKFQFRVGCATGIDRCLREAVAASRYSSRCTVHCAFPSRVAEAEALGLKAVCHVADASSCASALHWRTVIMVRECSLLVLFPDSPTTGTWGKGSLLAFNTAVQDHIPVFVVTTIPPLGTEQYTVVPASLFGIVDGYWVVPLGVEVHA